jgi:hypothetical protein
MQMSHVGTVRGCRVYKKPRSIGETEIDGTRIFEVE